MRSDEISSGETIYSQDINGLRKDAQGSGGLLAHQMLGTLAIGTQPTNTKIITLTVNSTAIVLTAVSSIGSTAGNFLIGANDAATLANLMALLANPSVTNTTQVALSAANQQLLSYLDFALVGTSIYISSLNTVANQLVSTFTCSTTITSATYTANTLALFVEPCVCYVNGTEVYFAGGITPTVTAPSSHPRIDVLTIDSTGTLAWTVGTENASPATPAYPANKLPICEILNVVSETILNDNANFNASQGWIQNDVRPFMSTGLNLAAVADSILPATDNTYNLGSASFTWANIYAKNNIYVNGLAAAISKFGGTGADGALTITASTTTHSLGSARSFVKNFSSISITGTTGAYTFSSPHAMGTYIKIRSQAGLVVTSTATAAVIGDGLGASAAHGIGGAVQYNSGSIGSGISAGGGGGGGSCAGFGATGGGTAAGIGGSPTMGLAPWADRLEPGGGGSGGEGGYANGFSGGTPGTGSPGGAAIDFEIAGNINITSTFSSVGSTGGNSPNNVSGGYSGGSGGGGGGGSFRVMYGGSVTANTATFTVTGGAGGTPGSGGTSGSTGGAGANGDSLVAPNTYFA
jgi:hypothetical protein